MQHIPLKLGQAYVYHCVTSPFLPTLNKYLGTEDTSCWRLVGVILSILACCTSSVNEQQVWIASRPVQYLHPFTIKPRGWIVQHVLALSCWNKQWCPWKRRCLDGSMRFSKPWMFFQHWWCHRYVSWPVALTQALWNGYLFREVSRKKPHMGSQGCKWWTLVFGMCNCHPCGRMASWMWGGCFTIFFGADISVCVHHLESRSGLWILMSVCGYWGGRMTKRLLSDS